MIPRADVIPPSPFRRFNPVGLCLLGLLGGAPALGAQSTAFDIFPGAGGSGSFSLTEAGGSLWFSASDGMTGIELWRIDGAGTTATLVEDVPGQAAPDLLTNVGGVLYFVGNEINFGRELYKSPGAGMGTVLVRDVNVGTGPSSMGNLIGLGGDILFTANPFDGTTGKELYISNGTPGNGSLVKNINPAMDGSAFGSFSNPTLVGNEVFFFADDGTSGFELWKSDGTGVGTVRVADIQPGSGSSVGFNPNAPGTLPPLRNAVIGGTMYFPADDGTHGVELWKSDGVTTEMVVDLLAGPASGLSPISGMAVLNGEVIFGGNNGSTGGNELFKTDGTAVALLRDIHPTVGSNPTEIVQVGSLCFLAADDGTNGFELWATDGTPGGTALVSDINDSGDSFPSNFLDVDGVAYFSAGDAVSGNELWRSDGTDAGTVQVEAVGAGALSSLPVELVRIGEKLFFVADDPTNGREVHVLDLPEPDPVASSSSNGANGGSTGDPIDTFTGELFELEAPDLMLGGPMGLAFQRYYASGLRKSFVLGDLGSNWRHNFDASLQISGTAAIYIASSGRVTKFNRPVVPGPWVQLTHLDTPYQLVSGGGVDATLYDPQIGRVLTFDYTSGGLVTGKLVRVEDGHGRAHDVTYDLPTGQILGVSDGLGRTLSFTYNADTLPKIDSVSDGLRTVLFSYTDAIDPELLTMVTDARGGMSVYSYADTSGTADHGLLLTKQRPELNVPFTQTYYPVPSLSSGRVASQTDADGNRTELVYDSSGRETTITDPEGNSEVHGHTAGGELEELQDQQGLNVFIANDVSGRRTGLTDRLGDGTSFTYHEPSGKLETHTNAEGGTTRYTYEARSFGGIMLYDLAGITHPDNTTEAFVRDADGLVTSYTDQAGNTASATFGALGRPLTETNAAGASTTHTYNAAGQLMSTTDHAGNATTFGYDPAGRVNLITAADMNTRSFTYDAMDNALTATDEDGQVTTFTYDDNGNRSTVRDPFNEVTSFTYDGNDRLLAVQDPLGGTRSRTYDALGRIDSMTDPNGNTSRFSYDVRGRLVARTRPGMQATLYGYDSESVLSSMTDPLGNVTSYMADRMGRTVRTTSPLGNVRSRAYDSMGRLATRTDPLGRVISIGRDPRGLVTSVTRSGATTTYLRNELGRITRITDAGGNDWGLGFDPMGRVTSSTDPLGQVTTFSYDSRNRLATVGFPGALGTLTRTHDARGRITQDTYSDGTVLNLGYDAAGRLTSGTGITATFDRAGRLTESNGLILGRDAGGRMTTVTLAPGKTLTYVYDVNDRCVQVRDWAGGVTDFTYDDADRLLAIERPNGIDGSRSYDAEGRVLNLSEGALASIALTRDAAGRVSSATRTQPTAPSAIMLDDEAVSFDAAGQVVGASYDELGRLIDDGTTTFAWDLASRLTSYERGGATTASTYDAAGLRISRTRGGVTRSYLWNAALSTPSVSVERESGGDLFYYVHTPDGRLLYRLSAADDSRDFYHFDEMGNTLFLSDDAGSVTASYAHSPFGRELGSQGTVDNPFTWGGEFGVMDEGDSLYYIRQRYFDARTGRFVSRDPIRWFSPDRVNPYQFANGDPLRFIDRNGMAPEESDEVRDARHRKEAQYYYGGSNPMVTLAALLAGPGVEVNRGADLRSSHGSGGGDWLELEDYGDEIESIIPELAPIIVGVENPPEGAYPKEFLLRARAARRAQEAYARLQKQAAESELSRRATVKIKGVRTPGLYDNTEFTSGFSEKNSPFTYFEDFEEEPARKFRGDMHRWHLFLFEQSLRDFFDTMLMPLGLDSRVFDYQTPRPEPAGFDEIESIIPELQPIVIHT